MKSFAHLLALLALLSSTTAVAQRGSAASKSNSLPKTVVAMNVAAEPAAKPAVVAPPVEPKYFKGTVVDEMGEPLAGAVVSVVIGNNQFSSATTTNASGDYLLQCTAAAPVLLVSYAGYEEIQQKATYARPITFQLEPIANYERQLKKQNKAAEKAWRK